MKNCVLGLKPEKWNPRTKISTLCLVNFILWNKQKLNKELLQSAFRDQFRSVLNCSRTSATSTSCAFIIHTCTHPQVTTRSSRVQKPRQTARRSLLDFSLLLKFSSGVTVLDLLVLPQAQSGSLEKQQLLRALTAFRDTWTSSEGKDTSGNSSGASVSVIDIFKTDQYI